MTILRKLLGDEQGVAAVEYGLLAALISISAVGAMAEVGNQLSNTFETATAAMARHNR